MSVQQSMSQKFKIHFLFGVCELQFSVVQVIAIDYGCMYSHNVFTPECMKREAGYFLTKPPPPYVVCVYVCKSGKDTKNNRKDSKPCVHEGDGDY